jgi:hypothetical protein
VRLFLLAVMRSVYIFFSYKVMAAFIISLYSVISAFRSLILSSRVDMSESREDKTR